MIYGFLFKLMLRKHSSIPILLKVTCSFFSVLNFIKCLFGIYWNDHMLFMLNENLTKENKMNNKRILHKLLYKEVWKPSRNGCFSKNNIPGELARLKAFCYP